MAKIFIHRVRKLRPFSLPLIASEDPEKRRARLAAERRERERIESDRRRRMLDRNAARAIHSASQMVPKDQSDLDNDWFAAHPGRSYRVRRKVAGEIPAHLDQRHWKWVAICQVQPGMRVRLPFNFPLGKSAFLDMIRSEAGSKIVFDEVARDPEARSLDVEPGRLEGEG